MLKKILRFFSKISVRILLLNILIVFIPVASVLLLETYEDQLLDSLEHALYQQGRVLSASLSENGGLGTDDCMKLIKRLEKKHEARIRIVDSGGHLLADSSQILKESVSDNLASENSASAEYEEERIEEKSAAESVLYNIASYPVRVFRKYFLPPPEMPMEKGEFYSETDILMGSEIRAALEGRYQAATRISSGGQVSVTLYTAIPITDQGNIIGAVLVSQSTYRILQDLYELRLNIFKIFAASILIALFISFILSLTISRPLRKIQKEALRIMDSRGRLTTHFKPSKYRDEIGDLGNSLHYLTKQVNKHTQFIESFSSDVSHEFRNPLASIRSASEMLAEADTKKDREKFAEMIRKDIKRLEDLLTDVREISYIDTRLEQDQKEKINIYSFLSGYIKNFKNRYPEKNPVFHINCRNRDLSIEIAETRLYQIFNNIIGNAVEFSPPKGKISITMIQDNKKIRISIADQGPGIPDEMKEKIFERFYSSRKDENKHSGLGLSIVHAIITGIGGSITVSDNESSGSVFILEFPAL